jgi:hypothetical protein
MWKERRVWIMDDDIIKLIVIITVILLVSAFVVGYEIGYDKHSIITCVESCTLTGENQVCKAKCYDKVILEKSE